MSMNEDALNALKRSLSGNKTISEAAGIEKIRLSLGKEINSPMHTPNIKLQTIDQRDAEIELSYIDAAIALAKGSNAIGAEVHIGPFTVGISLNVRLIPLLEAEAEEIRKYLRGEANNYE